MDLHSVIAYYDSLSELQQEVTYLNTLGPGGVQISDWIRETILFVYKAKIFVDVIILGVRLFLLYIVSFRGWLSQTKGTNVVEVGWE